MRNIMGILCILLICGCSEKKDFQSSDSDTNVVNKNFNTVLSDINDDGVVSNEQQLHTVLEILDRPGMRDSMPAASRISYQEYIELKDKYAHKHENYKPGYAITYRQKEGDSWRSYWLTLESFDDDSIWIAELTQYKSRGWDWVSRYQIEQSPEANEEFKINEILEERSKVIGGIKYGMLVSELIAVKGNNYKVNLHAEGGSADLIYDDIVVSVRQWWPGSELGRVIRVKSITKKE
jgi:hypothetical protein